MLYEYSHDGRLTAEGLQGAYMDGGVVMQQLNKQVGVDAQKPKWQLEIDPFSRYEPLAKLAADRYKGAKALENMHPAVRRHLKVLQLPEALVARALLSVRGRELAAPPADLHNKK